MGVVNVSMNNMSVIVCFFVSRPQSGMFFEPQTINSHSSTMNLRSTSVLQVVFDDEQQTQSDKFFKKSDTEIEPESKRRYGLGLKSYREKNNLLASNF